MVSFQQLSESARSWAGQLTGHPAYWIVLALMLTVCAHYLLMSTILFRLFVTWRGALIRLIHPDMFPKGSAWRDRFVMLHRCLTRGHLEPFDRDTERDSVSSGRRHYELLEELPGGDLCTVHIAVNNDQRIVLKQTLTPAGNQLLDKEQDILRQLLNQGDHGLWFPNCGQYLPWPEESFLTAQRRVNTYVLRDGFTDALSIHRQYPSGLDARHCAWMFKRLLEILGFAHQWGWIHGGVLPPHLLFHNGNHGLQLLGWIHSERCGTPLRHVPLRYKAWYPPECHMRCAATEATDIYLAAQCIVWLAGGDPLTATIPDLVPREMRQCLRQCLSESPRRRPQDAWRLHHQFTELLEDVFGPPRFCHLELS